MKLVELLEELAAVAVGAGFLRYVWWPQVRSARAAQEELDRRTEHVKQGIIRMAADLKESEREVERLQAENEELRARLSSTSG